MFGEGARLSRRAWGIALFVALLGVAALLARPSANAAADARASSRVGITPSLRAEHAPPRRTLPSTPFTLPAFGASPELVVFPPRSSGNDTNASAHANEKRPVAVMLHGMCGAPESTCAPIANAITRDRWLVCPRSPLSCGGGGGGMWSMRDAPAQIEASVARLAALDPAHVDADADRTLLGFSFGATIAVQVVDASARARDREHARATRESREQEPLARWSRVILLGADVAPDARAMHRAGVDRMLLGAGDFDMMRDRMSTAADRLQRDGATARFMSLGAVGHSYAYDMDAWMLGALAWVDAVPATS